ncbi:hypothetical protein HRbin17_02016 [bacterium HR17]|uniref:Uncharacterized protein n=1 Tax=Candidatus Fervidibacter japonicus TaxID=2035412 RepID=A0A2H5XE80_9BACT|nr:hypothetical protein HRbin17_02016 [bacterium HR17]
MSLPTSVVVPTFPPSRVLVASRQHPVFAVHCCVEEMGLDRRAALLSRRKKRRIKRHALRGTAEKESSPKRLKEVA